MNLKYEYFSYIINDKNQDAFNSHAQLVHLFKKLIELGLIVSGLSTIWEDTDGFAKTYMWAL